MSDCFSSVISHMFNWSNLRRLWKLMFGIFNFFENVDNWSQFQSPTSRSEKITNQSRCQTLLIKSGYILIFCHDWIERMKYKLVIYLSFKTVIQYTPMQTVYSIFSDSEINILITQEENQNLEIRCSFLSWPLFFLRVNNVKASILLLRK